MSELGTNLGLIGRRLKDSLFSCLIALIGLARGFPLFFSKRPKTPLRVLCIIAFDTLHKLRGKKWLPRHVLQNLAVFLDFGACANAKMDRKNYCQNEFHLTAQFLDQAGLGRALTEYRQSLDTQENGRPHPGGNAENFHRVRLYREAVARLSLGMLGVTAFDLHSLDEAMGETKSNGYLNILFRMVMQCQILDDILDYSKDRFAQLPGFLTACESLPLALDLTRKAAEDYAFLDSADLDYAKLGQDNYQPTHFPFRVALFSISLGTRLAIMLRRMKAKSVF